MNRLFAFLHPVQAQEEKEIVVSNRFLDEEGKVVPFKIRALTQEENDAITKKSRRIQKVNGMPTEQFDSIAYNRNLVVAGTVFPDFAEKELCEAYGVLDPTQVPVKMLKAGEFAALLEAICQLSGFGADNVEEEVKN